MGANAARCCDTVTEEETIVHVQTQSDILQNRKDGIELAKTTEVCLPNSRDDTTTHACEQKLQLNEAPATHTSTFHHVTDTKAEFEIVHETTAHTRSGRRVPKRLSAIFGQTDWIQNIPSESHETPKSNCDLTILAEDSQVMGTKSLSVMLHRTSTVTQHNLTEDVSVTGTSSCQSFLNKVAAQTGVNMYFPMYLMSMEKLMSMKSMRPHQDVKAKGLLHQWTEEDSGRVVFISHEWLGMSHADPDSLQLTVLQKLFARLMGGQVPKVESHFMQQLFYGKVGTVVTAEEWAAALPWCSIWFDFICIPQVSASSGKASLKGELQAAVDSIPAYVEHSSLVIVLAPCCPHRDKKGDMCTFSTWRSRGWCRLELQAALLACVKVQIMVCQGAEIKPYFMKASDGWKLKASEGNFTCCTRNHTLNGETIECDKTRASAIVSRLLIAKHGYAKEHEPKEKWRHLACVCQWLAGNRMPCLKTKSDGSDLSSDVSSLRHLLAWEDADEKNTKITGRSLLYYAALSDDQFAMVGLLQGFGPPEQVLLLDTPVKDPELAWGERPFTPLMAGMVYGSFPVVKQLLEARADPGYQNSLGDAFVLACAYGRSDNVAAWLRFFPYWDTDRREEGAVTALGSAACNAPEPGATAVCTVLLAAKADVNAEVENKAGCQSVLGYACSNDNSVPNVVTLLLEARANVNHQPSTQKEKQRRALKKAHQAFSSGDFTPFERHILFAERCTPLMWAIVRGKLDEVQVLMHANADVTLRNDLGQTAADVAEHHFGGEIPSILEELLHTYYV